MQAQHQKLMEICTFVDENNAVYQQLLTPWVRPVSFKHECGHGSPAELVTTLVLIKYMWVEARDSASPTSSKIVARSHPWSGFKIQGLE